MNGGTCRKGGEGAIADRAACLAHDLLEAPWCSEGESAAPAFAALDWSCRKRHADLPGDAAPGGTPPAAGRPR